MLPLHCPAQNYAWGRPAARSEVAKLAKANGTHVDDGKPFAELWMGTHCSGPAMIQNSTIALKDWIEAHPESVGESVYKKWGADLPFLFKVLSVQTALSIQSHPDKKLAEKLHAQNPQMYKDDNHKPEMALAITDFEALSSFVSQEELNQVFSEQPELVECIGSSIAHKYIQADEKGSRQALREAFTALMTCDTQRVYTAISDLTRRLNKQSSIRSLTEKEMLVLRLNEQYPNDVGVLAAFFLNLVKLKKGQAIYLAANEPHAYVSGELVECMATSDNVIRAGLTPKFRDTEILCESLTYTQGGPLILEGEKVHDHVKVYRPPFEEFEVHLIHVGPLESVPLPTNLGPLLFLVQDGHGVARALPNMADVNLKSELEIWRGSIFFVPASTSLTISAAADDIVIWVAACNARVFALPAVHANGVYEKVHVPDLVMA